MLGLWLGFNGFRHCRSMGLTENLPHRFTFGVENHTSRAALRVLQRTPGMHRRGAATVAALHTSSFVVTAQRTPQLEAFLVDVG